MVAIDPMLVEKRERILELAARHRARRVRVFGSTVKGGATAASDVDFLVDFEAGSSLLDQVGLWQALSELLGRRVDVVDEAALHWFIRDRVMQEAVPL